LITVLKNNKEVVAGVGVVSVIMSYLFNGVFNSFAAMVYTAQMIFLMPGLKLDFPANVQVYYKTL
jgi:hypothetical protein